MRSSGICGVYLLRAEESCSFGSKYSAYLVTVEQGDQLVGHAKLPTFQCWRYHGFHSFKLLRWISPQIDFGRLNIIMPQPHLYFSDNKQPKYISGLIQQISFKLWRLWCP